MSIQSTTERVAIFVEAIEPIVNDLLVWFPADEDLTSIETTITSLRAIAVTSHATAAAQRTAFATDLASLRASVAAFVTTRNLAAGAILDTPARTRSQPLVSSIDDELRLVADIG